MHEENGIVYSDNPEPMLTVLEVRHMYSGVYLLKFSNGVTKLFDTTILEIDCAPEYMYEHGFVYNTEDVVSVA